MGGAKLLAEGSPDRSSPSARFTGIIAGAERRAPEKPIIFTKFSTALNQTGGLLVWSAELTQAVDFEAELAVVIGKPARYVADTEALDCVFGYTIANDVTARDLQYGDKQWVRGKSLDTFAPMGPVLVTADEIPDPQALRIRSE
jgi:2-keto-4-pentenoate hydratase/2-oxohepta-3-ene-1,7-dioic acid hydratase in catechol pathway